MTRDKQIKSYAKSLFKLCLLDGAFSEERASAVLQVLEKNPPRNYISVLRAFHKYVQREIANQTAEVEYAGAISETTVQKIAQSLSASYGRSIAVESKQNDDLIAGLRVRVGCDVYESSIAGALRELQSSLS